jgi:quinol-cytochrome oxidoreductase complex cytochrome b subunit
MARDRLLLGRVWVARVLVVDLVALAVTGATLHFRYRPATASAVDAVREIHRVASAVFIWTAAVFAVLQLAARRWSRCASAATVFVLALAASFTGFLLPWDQLALWAVTIGSGYRGYTWLFDHDVVRFVIIRQSRIGLGTLRFWYVVHAALVLPLTVSLRLASRSRRAERQVDEPSTTSINKG